MNKLGRIAAFAALPLLAGCFGFTQSMSITAGGEVTMVTELAVSTDMMAMAFDGEDGSEFCPTEPDTELPATFTITYEEFVRDTDTVCLITAVGPIDDLAEAIETGALMPTEGDEGAPVITLTDEGGGVFTYSLALTSQGEEGEPDPDEAAMMAMLGPIFEGRALTWSITAPRLLEVNDDAANVTVEGNTATITVPALEMLTEPGIEYLFTVRFALN